MKYELLWQDAFHKTDKVFKSDNTAKMLAGDMSMAIQGYAFRAIAYIYMTTVATRI